MNQNLDIKIYFIETQKLKTVQKRHHMIEVERLFEFVTFLDSSNVVFGSQEMSKHEIMRL